MHSPFAGPQKAIDYDILKRPDPILWFDDVCLFESELDDNGISKMSVKVRVMPGSLFILLRFWMRLDGVCARVSDTRIFHTFGSNDLVVEVSRKSLDFATLLDKCGKAAGNAYYNDVNNFIWALEEKEKFCKSIDLKTNPGLAEKTEL